MRMMARGGLYYVITFIDDFSRYGYVVLMKNKSNSSKMFKEYKAKAEKKTREKYKSFTIRSWRRILKP